MHIQPTPKQLEWWKRCDPALLIIIIAFIAFEIVARYHFHNSNGWWTLSNRIVTFQDRVGWPARVLVNAGIVALAVHLAGVY